VTDSQSPATQRTALVFGGTGAVGSEVLRGLARAGVRATFTYHQQEEKARVLETELGHRAARVDLTQPGAIRALMAELVPAPTLFIHCAALGRFTPMADLDDAAWDATQSVNVRSAFVACQALAPHLRQSGRGDIVLCGAVERAQSIPGAVHFAASQGALGAMAAALARELGPAGVRVNLVALGLLDAGLSRDLDAKVVADYKTFSALRRVGTPAEAAKAVLWLALENTYMSGKVLPVSGGI
jgi:NAD(P)-dependent dehydrogenase (short-subunit alcohol dehydrogenase family)